MLDALIQFNDVFTRHSRNCPDNTNYLITQGFNLAKVGRRQDQIRRLPMTEV